jgi:hypothetical protein
MLVTMSALTLREELPLRRAFDPVGIRGIPFVASFDWQSAISNQQSQR